MMEPKSDRKRCRYAGARALLLVMIGCVVTARAVACARRLRHHQRLGRAGLRAARADVYRLHVGVPADRRHFTANGSLRHRRLGGLQGTIDVVSGAVAGSGGVTNLTQGSLVNFSFTGSVAPSGSTISVTISGVVTGSLTASLCRNRNLDPGEACDDGLTYAGCCTPTCTVEPDGTSCSTTLDCQIAPTCAAGACVGAHRGRGHGVRGGRQPVHRRRLRRRGFVHGRRLLAVLRRPVVHTGTALGDVQGPDERAQPIDLQSTPFGAKDRIVWTVPRL